jgi:hypothetical protein
MSGEVFLASPHVNSFVATRALCWRLSDVAAMRLCSGGELGSVLNDGSVLWLSHTM